MDQLLIDLENVALPKLQEFAARFKVDVRQARTKHELIQRLYKEVSRSRLIKAADDYIYAGRTSLTWFRFEKLASGFFRRASLKNLLRAICDGQDPFVKPRRPELAENPEIISARQYRHNKARILMAMRGPERRVFLNYEYRSVAATIFTNTMLDTKRNIFEVRANAYDARKIARWFSGRLKASQGNPREIDDFSLSQLTITQTDLVTLKQKLAGILDEYMGKETTPSIYDTKKFTKSPACDDLWVKPSFQRDIRGLDPRRWVIIFASPFDAGEKVRLEVSTKLGSFYVRSYVSEGVIQYVYEAVLSLKGIR